MLHICPAAEARDYLFPLFGEREDALTAEIVEFFDTEIDDVFFGFRAKLFFYNVLDRETVAIPPPLPLDAVALHRFVARHRILDGALEKVAIMRQPCG